MFASPERAGLVDRINRALRKSKTWEQFRKAMPRTAYSEVIQLFDQNCEPRPRGSDKFSAESVPGFSDGDYPPWLQAEMDLIEDYAFWQRFGQHRSTMLNGSFWLIPHEKREAVCAALRERGWEVKYAPKLEFW